MLVTKSNEQAAKFQEIANELLADGKLYEALITFNKSLCFAGPESLEMALAFEARSQIYHKIGQHKKCLKNIQAARDHGYPVDLLEKLENRQKECEKFIEENSEDPQQELLDFLKLSHPANEKIPFLIDGLELREDEKFGRYVITTKDLLPGDVIAVEESRLHFISPKTIFSRCFNCFKSNMLDLMPSSSSVMFCSEKCHQTALEKFEKEENIQDSISSTDIRQKMLRILSESLNAAGGFDELKNLIQESEGKTIFDFDFNNASDKELFKIVLICANSAMAKRDCGVESCLRAIMAFPAGDKKDFLVNFVAGIILKYLRNGVKVPGKFSNLPEGGMFLPLVSILNHSCDPNIYTCFVENKHVLFVIRPISAGEQIFISYRKTFMEQPLQERRNELLKAYEFKCECDACVNEFPMPNKLKKADKHFILPTFGKFGGNSDLIFELKENFRLLKENSNLHPCYETAAIVIRSKELNRTVCERIMFRAANFS